MKKMKKILIPTIFVVLIGCLTVTVTYDACDPGSFYQRAESDLGIPPILNEKYCHEYR